MDDEKSLMRGIMFEQVSQETIIHSLLRAVDPGGNAID